MIIDDRTPFGGDEFGAFHADDKVGEDGGIAEEKEEKWHKEVHVGEGQAQGFLDHECGVDAGFPMAGCEDEEDAHGTDNECVKEDADDG